MKSTRTSLAILAAGLLSAAASAATSYSGSWRLSNGTGGSLFLQIDGSRIVGRLLDNGWYPAGLSRSVLMSGTYTGRRFKVTMTYPNGSTSLFQGNIDFRYRHVDMSGLRYTGDRPDGGMRFIASADRVGPASPSR